MATTTDPTEPGDPVSGSPADDSASPTSSLPPATAERRRRLERRARRPAEGEAGTDDGTDAAAATSLPWPAASHGDGVTADAAERRRRKRRQRDRAAVAASGSEPGAPVRLSRRRESMRERRQERQLKERRDYWAGVRREVERLKLEAFLHTLGQLAQLYFGPSATVVPHMRGRAGRRHVIIVVDAAHPEAIANYEDFLPLEEQFWTAYGTLDKPAAAVIVAVRPARGWLRSEERAPLFTEFGGQGMIS